MALIPTNQGSLAQLSTSILWLKESKQKQGTGRSAAFFKTTERIKDGRSPFPGFSTNMTIPTPFIGALPVPQALDFITKTSKVVGACRGKPYIGPVADLLQSVIELYQGNSHHSYVLF